MDERKNTRKDSSKFVIFLRKIFVNNIGLKIFSLVFAILMSLIIMGIRG